MYPELEYIILALTFGYCFLGDSKYYVGYLSCLKKNYLVFLISLVSCVFMITMSMVVFKGLLLGTAIAVALSFLLQLVLCNFFTDNLINKWQSDRVC